MNSGMDLKGLTLEEIRDVVTGEGERPYRAGQIYAWIYRRGVSSLAEMTDLGRQFREKLGAGGYYVGALQVLAEQESRLDGTRKYLFGLADGHAVESVLLCEDDRATVCFSTQVGCHMNCSFCATGRSGFVRNLTAGEMIDQIIQIGRRAGVRVTNGVAMGQGEPLANYDQTVKALRLLNSADGPNIGARHLTVSTCGVVPGILRLAREPEQFGLAVSLHSARDDQRSQLMPINRRYGLSELREACREYVSISGRRVTFEYALISGETDTDADWAALINFCRGFQCYVNLIPLNPVSGVEKNRSDPARVRFFADKLAKAGIAVSIRKEKGADLDAACGQLRQRQVLLNAPVIHD